MIETSSVPSSLAGNLGRIIRLLSPRRKLQLAALITLMLVSALAEMATLGAVMPFLALLAGDGDGVFVLPVLDVALSLQTAAILFGLIAVGAAMMRMFTLRFGFGFTYGVGEDLGREVYRNALYQPYSWHVARNSSEILAAISKVDYVVFHIINPLLEALVATVMAVSILAMLMIIDAQTALFAGVAFGALYGVTSWFAKTRLDRHSRIIANAEGKRIKAVQEGLGGIREVLLDGMQKLYVDRFSTVDTAMRRSQAKINVLSILPRYMVEAVGMVMILGLALWLSAREGGLAGAIPILGALAIGAQKMLPQMQQIYFSWSWIVGNLEHLSDVLDILEQPMPQAEMTPPLVARQRRAPARLPLVPGEPIIAIRGVDFRYVDDGPLVLDQVNLDVERGARIGFVGKTGSGKSTLIDLVMGLLEPVSGVIAVEGAPLGPGNLRAWQTRLAHVPQSIFLSDSSIAENIAFGIEPDAIDMDRVRTAASVAQIAEFIESQPDGYGTMVGERGVRLSGGQRQRIGLARAFYRDVDVLILDEATSALDDATEAAVMDAIHGLRADLTVLMIAHRLSTLSRCDAIVEVVGGRVAMRTSLEPVPDQ